MRLRSIYRFYSHLHHTMPRTRASAVTPDEPVRRSPRKRKRNDEVEQVEDIDSPAQSAHKENEAKSPKRNRNKNTAPVANAIGTTRAPQSRSKIAKPEVDNGLNHSGPEQKGRGKGKSTQVTIAAKEEVDVITDQKHIETVISTGQEVIVEQDGKEEAKKVVRKRRTKEEIEAEAMPLAARTKGLNMFVGAHVSIAKGVENAITNALRIGGNSFALFLKSQRKWDNPALKDENRDAFKHHCTNHQYDQSSHVVPHGSYLVNLASPDGDMSKKSYDAFVDDLHRCEALGIKYYNFHPGSTNKEPLDEAIARLAGNLNRALAETSTVIPLLENMAGHGSIIGSRFSDLRDIIAAIKPEFKSRIGICIDTCHTFAAGYDLRSPEAYKKTLQELDDTVGLQYLKAMHMNDSKAPLNSHRDLHQNIGVGFLGLRAFHNIMNDHRLQNLPLVLETPCDRVDPENPKKTIDDKNVWAREIKLLESLIGMDPESKGFKQLEADLSAQGRAEREKMSQSITARDEKARKKASKELEKGQKSINAMFGGKSKKHKEDASSSPELSDVDSDA